ncbi:MAG: rRNA maturation RNase YbeY [Alphaproteobacteria bacterium]|nr:rRNA maturation RNase YbeY [Alphaproteobacteria bacterium]
MSADRQSRSPRARSGVTIVVADPAWRRALPRPVGWVREVAQATLAAAGRMQDRLTVALADDQAVRVLNARYRGQDKPTNVLSFPSTDLAEGLGDIILARQTVLAEASRQGKPNAHHLAHLVAHGVLHLLGHDHARAGAAARMERLERRVLAGFAIPDPYRLPARTGWRAA